MINSQIKKVEAKKAEIQKDITEDGYYLEMYIRPTNRYNVNTDSYNFKHSLDFSIFGNIYTATENIEISYTGWNMQEDKIENLQGKDFEILKLYNKLQSNKNK